jgi:molybdopterin-binding protein
MNRFLGTIIAIESNEHLSLVDVVVGQDTFTSMLMETPQKAPYLKVGNTVTVLFKETEVSLAKNFSGEISLRNIVSCTVRQIRRGDILCEVVLDYQEQMVVSIITTRAVKRLELKEGDEVGVLVKANEVSLMEVHDEL